MSDLEFRADHVIDTATGRRYALSCPWDPTMVGCEIPAFLILTAEERTRLWEGVKVTDQRTGQLTDDIEQRLAAEREQRKEIRKAKNAKGLAKVKASHPNERYDRKTKTWMPKPPSKNSKLVS